MDDYLVITWPVIDKVYRVQTFGVPETEVKGKSVSWVGVAGLCLGATVLASLGTLYVLGLLLKRAWTSR